MRSIAAPTRLPNVRQIHPAAFRFCEECAREMTLNLRPFGKNRRRLAFLVCALGVYTFFLPMVILNPPLLGRTEWSPLNMAVNIYLGNFPVRRGRFDETLIEIGVIYLLILFSLIVMWLPGRPEILFSTSSFGVVLSFLGKFWEHGFLLTFGWEYFGRLHRGITWWLLPFVMPALVAICLSRGLDKPDAPA